MEDCRGQGYDGAGNMAGRYNGAARLIQNVYKSALYVHCFSHQLNLCIAATPKIMSIDKVMNNVRIVSDFFNNSLKRQQLLEKVLVGIITESKPDFWMFVHKMGTALRWPRSL